RQDNRSRLPLAAGPTWDASFRLLTLSCRYGMLFGSDCNDDMLRDVTGVKRGDTVGVCVACVLLVLPPIVAEHRMGLHVLLHRVGAWTSGRVTFRLQPKLA